MKCEEQLLEDPNVGQQESMSLLCDHLDLTRLLIRLKQLSVCVFDEVTKALIGDHLAESGEVESGDHVAPVFFHKVADKILLANAESLVSLLPHGFISYSSGLEVTGRLNQSTHSLLHFFVDCMLVEATHLRLDLFLLLFVHVSEVFSDSRQWEVR